MPFYHYQHVASTTARPRPLDPQAPRPPSHLCSSFAPRSLRPHVLLVLICTPHAPDNLLAFLGAQAALLSHDLAQHDADLSRHVSRVTADIEVGLL